MAADHASPARRGLVLASLGAVHAVVGTSPLYAMKACLAWQRSSHAIPQTPDNLLGMLSLMLWALLLVVCVQYVVIVLRADNHGEGGVLALVALVAGRDATRLATLAAPLLLGLFGVGLVFADGAIAPAISMLGAIEGLAQHSPALGELVAPITIGILLGLFLVQRHGAGRVAGAFGPVMLLWFAAIGAAGVRWILVEPAVLSAINPLYGISFLATHGVRGFALVGLVFLVVTGGEALYACMGQFGRTPIRIAWFTVALPGLLLNYVGQAALVMTRLPHTVTSPFYAMVDGPLLIPMLILAAIAAAVAAQTLIARVFSLTRQATQLGFLPRTTVVHTSATAEDQIYIPEMNWLLMLGCIALVLTFRTSSELAAVYGSAISGIMGITSYLFYVVCRRRWGQSRVRALAFLVPFLAIDLALFSANAMRLGDGGWLPLAIAACLLGVMTTWWRGRMELSRLLESSSVPEALLFAELAAQPPLRVSGTAVFMASKPEGIPNVLLHHFKHNQALHRHVELFSVQTELVPWIGAGRAIAVADLGHGFFRVVARVGFMQTPDIPQLLRPCELQGISTEPMTTTYYLGRQTLLTGGRSRLARWRKVLFAFLSRNAPPPSSFFNLPPNRVVELGLQIEL